MQPAGRLTSPKRRKLRQLAEVAEGRPEDVMNLDAGARPVMEAGQRWTR